MLADVRKAFNISIPPHQMLRCNSDLPCCIKQMRFIERSLTGRRLVVGWTEQPSDHGQGFLTHRGMAGEGRAQVNVADVQAVASGASGGEAIDQTIEGLGRYPIQVRYPRETGDCVDDIVNLLVLTSSCQQITLGTVADVAIHNGAPMLRSEDGRPAT